MGDDAVEVTVKIQRGTGTDNRDTFSATVGGQSVDEVDEKMRQLRQKAEQWAAEFREIQPDDSRTAHLADDQRDLTGEEVKS
jgi:hypothetical protein